MGNNQKYITLQTKYLNNYQSLQGIYTHLHRLHRLIESVQKSLESRPPTPQNVELAQTLAALKIQLNPIKSSYNLTASAILTRGPIIVPLKWTPEELVLHNYPLLNWHLSTFLLGYESHNYGVEHLSRGPNAVYLSSAIERIALTDSNFFDSIIAHLNQQRYVIDNYNH